MAQSRKQKIQEEWRSPGVLGKDKFVQLHRDLYTSLAFRSLEPQAKIVFITILFQYKGDGNLTLICPYKDFKQAGVKSNATISKALTQLELYGFIKTEYGGIGQVPNKYTLIGKWQGIKTEEQVQAIRQEIQRRTAIKTGTGHSRHNANKGNTKRRV